MSATKFSGWLSMPDAAAKYRVRYETLRKLVADGVFTVCVFSKADRRPPKYLRPKQVAAWKSGGVAAVEALRAEEGE